MLFLLCVTATIGEVLYTKIGTNEACVGTEDGKTYAVSQKIEGIVTIPPSVLIEGVSCTVTTVGKRAFTSCASLSGIILPNTIKTLKSYCFETLFLSEPLIIPASVTKVETQFINGWYSNSLVFCGTKDIEIPSSFSLPFTLSEVIVPKNYEGDTFCTLSAVKTGSPGCPVEKNCPNLL